MARWMALESNFNLGLCSTIIYGKTLQSRQRGDPCFVESGRGKSPKWEVPEKKKWEVPDVGSARKKNVGSARCGKCPKKKCGKCLLWEVTVGSGVHPSFLESKVEYV